LPKKFSRRIKADFQSPRTKLLYFVHCAPKKRIKDNLGLKSKMSKALGYSSDGHFYYDLNYLLDSGMLVEKNGYIILTNEGKGEFEFYSTLFKNSIATFGAGIILLFYYLLLKFNLLTIDGIPMIGWILISVSALFLGIAKRNEPKLPIEARELLKETRK